MELRTASTMLENETSNKHFTDDGDPIITEKMRLEERMLEEETYSEECKLRKNMLEERKRDEEECFKRLQVLLKRCSDFTKVTAEQLQKYEKEMKRKIQELKSTNVENGSSKRKAASSSAKKKAKRGKKVANFLKNQEGNDLDVNADALETALIGRQPKLLTGGIMREYQIQGYEWLKTLFESGVNGILADEMGLGKTIQCIAFIAYLVEIGVSGPFLVCCPLTIVPNWYAEFQRFVPGVPVMIYHGDKGEREELAPKIKQKVSINDVCCYPVVITSYQIAHIDAPKLTRIKWKILVVDEAQRIKNYQCKLIQTLKKYKTVHRLLLTGTPLQNSLTELWSLLNFILPKIFDDLEIFQFWFDISRLAENGATRGIIAQEQEKQIVSKIHQILTPFLLRRTKSDVEPNLPPKKTVFIHAPMTELQHEYYMGILNDSIREFVQENEEDEPIITGNGRPKRKSVGDVFYGEQDDSEEANKIPRPHEKKNSQSKAKGQPVSEINLKLNNTIMCLRRICCHPYLISYPLDPYTSEYLVDENIVKTSGKMLILDTVLPQLIKRGHKILVFSQFVTMLYILEDYCTFRKFKYSCLHGRMKLPEREKQVKAFNEDESVSIFLISTRAGGLGLNLTAADTVITYDLDWNPLCDLQAQNRCHRIGQTKPVVVYNLFMPNTCDEKVLNYATAKRKLEKVILQTGRFSSKAGMRRQQPAISTEGLLKQLQTPDINNVVNADNFSIPPEELERILDRSDMIV